MSHLEKVQAMYAAFGRGDVPAILEHLAEDVEWEYGVPSTDVPWLQPRRGRDGAAAFFASLQALEFKVFRVKVLVESGDVVFATFDIEAVLRESGRSIVEEDEVHIWHFSADGLVTRFRHRADTHQHWLAYHGEA